MDRIVFAPRPRPVALAWVLVLAAAVLSGAAALRGREYDEGYTIFLAAGTPRPDWPAEAFRAGDMRAAYAGYSTAAGIARDLRATDVHPPLYFWAVAAWRGVTGTGLFTTRLFSVLCSVAALGLLAGLCLRLGLPPVASVLLTLGCYGFAYTGAIARGFALAQALIVAGMWLAAGAARPGRGFAAGLAFGAAMLTNYLAAFAGAASLLFLLLRQWRSRAWVAGGIGFALCLAPALWFFTAQRDSRTGQFPPFEPLPGLLRLARYAAASVFGGLPLYVDGAAATALAALLAVMLVAAVALIGMRWRGIARPDARLLLALVTCATPAGLVALGLVFDTTPIELRYLAFALPAFAALLAGALATLRPALRSAGLAIVLAVQAVALAGMLTRPETMQPQERTARDAAALAGRDGLVLVPRGNDGVGVAGAVVASVPDATRILVVPPATDAAALAARLAGERRVVLARLGVDADSRAALPLMEQAVAGACWRRDAVAGAAEAFDRRC